MLVETKLQPKQFSVYLHTDKTDGRKYIGITSQQPERRWQRGLGYVNNPYFFNLIKKRGWDGFEHEIVASGLTKEKSLDLEEKLIEKYKLQDKKYGINLRAGGLQNLPGVETRQNISKSLLGHEVSEKTRQLLMKNVPSKKVEQLLNGRVIREFESLSEAARSVGGLKSNIWTCCNGGRKSYHGFGWRYKDV